MTFYWHRISMVHVYMSSVIREASMEQSRPVFWENVTFECVLKQLPPSPDHNVATVDNGSCAFHREEVVET